MRPHRPAGIARPGDEFALFDRDFPFGDFDVHGVAAFGVLPGVNDRVDLRGKTVQVAVHGGVTVGMPQVKRLAVPSVAHAHPYHRAVGGGEDLLPDDELGLEVVSRVEMSVAQFAEGAGQNPFVCHGGGKVVVGCFRGLLGGAEKPAEREDREKQRTVHRDEVLKYF